SVYHIKDLGLELSSGSHVLPTELVTALDDATTILAAAKAEADRICSKAQSIVETERARGYADGLRQAQEDAAARLFADTALLQNRLAHQEAELIDLVIDCMRHLLDGFDDGEKCRVAIRGALNRMRREK